MTKLCKEYLKEKSTYNAQIAQLRNLGTLPSPEEGDKKDAADKTTKWVGVASGILGLFSSVLATASTLKKD